MILFPDNSHLKGSKQNCKCRLSREEIFFIPPNFFLYLRASINFFYGKIKQHCYASGSRVPEELH